MTSPVHEPSEYLTLLWSSLLQTKLVSGTETVVRLSRNVLHRATRGYARETATVTAVLCSLAPFVGQLHITQHMHTGDWEIQRESPQTREHDLAETLSVAAQQCPVLTAVLDKVKPDQAARMLLAASPTPVSERPRDMRPAPTASLASFDVAALDRVKRWSDE